MVGEQVVVFYEIPFRNANCNVKYTNHFSNQPVVLGRIVQYPFFKNLSLEVVYTRLVRMFYANLQINVEGTTLFLRVNGVDIVVNPYYNIYGNLDGYIMVYFVGPIQVHHNKILHFGKSKQTLGFDRPEEML
ncbi:hypothetical protein D8674_031142 [Pyrus ussuriensis x Pyrus communis]|uniref:Uncharacterized protein n=1 Tax=Pyrus ussuriensis x Pyrus communis TaxID=2448454 RepID=A0A5N5F350_9ROSA|nr:hypothetical protein D8674_031142 [Pyrus ussuriensis x Pyrus communis]